jgi:uncharacterized membrane protein YcaP (DUF421 family)
MNAFDLVVTAYRGELRRDELLRQRVSEEEVRSAVRSAGLPDLGRAGAVVLETDGTFSVIPSDALSNGDGPPGFGVRR